MAIRQLFTIHKMSSIVFNGIKKIFLLVVLASLACGCSFARSQQQVASNFIESFIDHYDFDVDGRYAHEYHPFLLDKTGESFIELEDRLRNEGFNLAGRIIISGYEEGAIPSYYTDFRESTIDDEATSKGMWGWSLRLHNRFGLMTGFLFKDINRCEEKWRKESQPFVEHIDPDEVEIFDDEGIIFQEHAFGEVLSALFDYKHLIEQYCKNIKSQALFDCLIDFWSALYSHEAKGHDKRMAATQDICFSIAYAQHLKKSELPLLHYYTGPDITYPIETFIGQTRYATRHAQAFVKKFSPRLKSINNTRTAYVFCSFVDGVGKSTMLGNVRNWLVYGNDVDSYDRVDNSSSQYAEIFSYGENTFIADLPAQVSHFTYKPDGLVYVPAETEVTHEELQRLRTHIRAHLDEYKKQFRVLFEDVRSTFEREGPFVDSLNDSQKPERAFMKNIVLLKKEHANTWVPFSFEGKSFLFNFFQPGEVRLCRPIAGASSRGLKNIESEQMLFFDGLRLPLSYKHFLNHFIALLKKHHIETIIFVDFTSMYPRSQRENIRLNYLLQQLALLDAHFDVNKSLYKNFVNPAELFADLLRSNQRNCLLEVFQQEVAVRLGLYLLLEKRTNMDVETIDFKQLTTYLHNTIAACNANGVQKTIMRLSREKLLLEYRRLKETFGLTKELHNVQLFSSELACLFSEKLQKLFVEHIVNDRLNYLWRDLDRPVGVMADMYMGSMERLVRLHNGPEVVERFEFSQECKDATFLGPCLRTIRAAWYAALANLIGSKTDSSGMIHISSERFLVPPFVLLPGLNGQIYGVQKLLDVYQDVESLDIMPYALFNLNDDEKRSWGEFDGKQYCLDWDNDGTQYGIFAYGLRGKNNRRRFFPQHLHKNKTSLINKLLVEYQHLHHHDAIMPTSTLYDWLEDNSAWHAQCKKRYAAAKKNGGYISSMPPLVDFSAKEKEDKAKRSEKDVFLGTQQHRPGAQLFVMMLATLEMIMKDPQSDIVVRFGNREDFKAALKLIEEITLPEYFGLVFKEPLFDNYDAVQPIIPWEYFDELVEADEI